jgi:hypothetical protein
MTDFYAQLEHQLVEAGRRRAGAGRLRRAIAARSGRPLVAVCAVLLAIAAGVTLAPLLRSSSSPSQSPSSEAGRGAAAPSPLPPPGPVALRGVRVTVLNGALRPGLGRAVATKLEERGATIVSIGNANDQTQPQTVVEYRSGAEAQARQVAAVLGLNAVAPLTGTGDRIARSAEVVVWAGRDRCDLQARCVTSTPGMP